MSKLLWLVVVVVAVIVLLGQVLGLLDLSALPDLRLRAFFDRTSDEAAQPASSLIRSPATATSIAHHHYGAG